MKLPSVYANKIDKPINNNALLFRGDRDVKRKDLGELKRCFDSKGYANRLSVIIETKDAKQLEKLVLCMRDYFVNIDNKKIYFEDIINYEIKK